MTDRPTDEQVAELLSATLYSYQAGEYPEGMTAWVDVFTDGDGGIINAITEWQAERQRLEKTWREVLESRKLIAQVRGMHFQYRAAAEGRFDCCAECNRVSRGYVPWPCATYLAITGDERGTVQDR